jgi:phosphoribosylanthranilate isomerase
MTWVKICGITNLEDALVAAEAGADAVGFVFYEKSPRKVSVEAAREIVEKLPEDVEKVGVFVGHSVDDAADVIISVGLTAIQHYPFSEIGSGADHQKATGSSIFPRPIKYFIAFPADFFLADPDRISGLASNFAHLRDDIAGRPPTRKGYLETFFLDSGGLQNPGGTGKSFDWEKAVPIADGLRLGGLKFVIAGGLRPENVKEAIGILQPWGVDVASGVEVRPGKKDPEKVQAFVRAVREIDRKAG